MRWLLVCGAMAMASDARLWAQEPDRGERKGPWQAQGTRGAVAAGGMEAVDAGMQLFRSGGNAVDAAVATMLAMTVTDAKLFCFGGEVPILVYDPKRRVVETIAAQGVAPQLATREHFLRKGGIPATGIEPAAVPAFLDGCLVALERYGTVTFAQAVAPTRKLLAAGREAWHADLGRTLERLVEAERDAGPDRKRGLRAVGDCFYRGPIAREIDAWSRANSGLIRFSDLATHVSRIEDPVTATYRGHVVCKCGPWTQGPVALQTLRLVEGDDLGKLGAGSPDAIHVVTEAMKLAFADRDVHYADPLFHPSPIRELLSDRYTSLRRPLLDRAKASLEYRPGDPIGGRALLPANAWPKGVGGPANDTTTCVTADADGWMVAATPSGWSGVVAGKTGVWLGTRLQSFNLWDGHPNCLAPGKRPRITLTPGIVLKDSRPTIAVSVAGGDGQDQAAIQVLTNLIDFRMSPAEAVSAPRFGTNHLVGSFRQTPPQLGSLLLDPQIPSATVNALANRGHRITTQKGNLWAPVAIQIDPTNGEIRAAGDPRAKRHAAAW